jgi:hypothetical protein
MMQHPWDLGFGLYMTRALAAILVWNWEERANGEREKRVAPEFGERKEEKNSTPKFRALQKCWTIGTWKTRAYRSEKLSFSPVFMASFFTQVEINVPESMYLGANGAMRFLYWVVSCLTLHVVAWK